MGVAERVHELARPEAADLRHHRGEQRVGGDVERHAEEDVGAALVELAREPPLRDAELEERVAGRQRHAVEIGRVPRRDDVAARIGILPDRLDDARDLVDRAAVRPSGQERHWWP